MRHNNTRRANARAGYRAQYGRRLVGPLPRRRRRRRRLRYVILPARVREAARTFNSVRVTGARARVWVSSVHDHRRRRRIVCIAFPFVYDNIYRRPGPEYAYRANDGHRGCAQEARGPVRRRQDRGQRRRALQDEKGVRGKGAFRRDGRLRRARRRCCGQRPPKVRTPAPPSSPPRQRGVRRRRRGGRRAATRFRARVHTGGQHAAPRFHRVGLAGPRHPVPSSVLVPDVVAPRLVGVVHVVAAPRFRQLGASRLALVPVAAAFLAAVRRRFRRGVAPRLVGRWPEGLVDGGAGLATVLHRLAGLGAPELVGPVRSQGLVRFVGRLRRSHLGGDQQGKSASWRSRSALHIIILYK